MNRAIKFRVWADNSDFNKPNAFVGWERLSPMGQWQYLQNGGFPEDDNSWDDGTLWSGSFRYIREQFTGLKDRNGVEIYEGDVLKTEHYRDPHKTMHYLLHVIKWDKDYGTWVAVNTNSESDSITEPGNCQLWVMMSRQEVEVDTNIHQNPELIK